MRPDPCGVPGGPSVVTMPQLLLFEVVPTR
jgi:hypothetical protein